MSVYDMSLTGSLLPILSIKISHGSLIAVMTYLQSSSNGKHAALFGSRASYLVRFLSADASAAESEQRYIVMTYKYIDSPPLEFR